MVNGQKLNKLENFIIILSAFHYLKNNNTSLCYTRMVYSNLCDIQYQNIFVVQNFQPLLTVI